MHSDNVSARFKTPIYFLVCLCYEKGEIDGDPAPELRMCFPSQCQLCVSNILKDSFNTNTTVIKCGAYEKRSLRSTNLCSIYIGRILILSGVGIC